MTGDREPNRDRKRAAKQPNRDRERAAEQPNRDRERAASQPNRDRERAAQPGQPLPQPLSDGRGSDQPRHPPPNRDRERAAQPGQPLPPPLSDGRGSGQPLSPPLSDGRGSDQPRHPPPNRDRERAATSGPLAYLITFRTYGTWLHGDARGSVDRTHNVPGTPLLGADPRRQREELRRCLHAPVTLDGPCRRAVQRTILEVCKHRGWTLHELNVRWNHVHVVLSADESPEQVVRCLKSWTTRRMKESRLLGPTAKPWSRHGSTLYLWKPREVREACAYVLDGQGDDLS